MGVDGPRKAAGHLQNTPRTRLPLAASGFQSALYCRQGRNLEEPGVVPWCSSSSISHPLLRCRKSSQNDGKFDGTEHEVEADGLSPGRSLRRPGCASELNCSLMVALRSCDQCQPTKLIVRSAEQHWEWPTQGCIFLPSGEFTPLPHQGPPTHFGTAAH